MLKDNWPRSLIYWASVAAIVFLCFWFAFKIILLAFAGALLAILIFTCAEWVEEHTPERIGPKLSYTATVLGIVVLAGLVGYWIVPRAISETGQIVQIVPTSISQVRDYLNRTDWGRHIVSLVRRSMGASNAGAEVTTLVGDLGTALEFGVVILVIGLYAALNAREYASELLSLVPETRRRNVAKTLQGLIYTLRWWLLGQVVPMVVLGIATMIGLWALGVPLAFALGLLTGVMIFIPYVGSWIAYIPTVLVSLTAGPYTAIYVTILYLGVHGVEGYILTPLVQRRAVLLPPVVTVLSQLFMWKVAGLLGIAVATPIAAALLFLVRKRYLRDS